MNAAHGRAIADAAMGGRFVVGGIDIHEGEPRSIQMATPVTLLEKVHLPHAEGAAAVVKNCELSHDQTLGKRATPLRAPNLATKQLLQLLQRLRLL